MYVPFRFAARRRAPGNGLARRGQDIGLDASVAGVHAYYQPARSDGLGEMEGRTLRHHGLGLVVVAILLGTGPIVGVPRAAGAQALEPSDLCLLAVEEVEEIAAIPFARATGSGTACAYTSDPAVDLYALDLRLEGSIDLSSAQFTYPRGGQETEVAGLPAWTSDDGLFVDVGEHILVVQPVFFLSDTTPDPVPVQRAVAELAVPRVGAALEALSGPGTTAGLEARFPSEVGGMPVFATVLPGDEFLQYVDLGNAGITEVLAAQDRTLADLLIGVATVSEGTDLIALQLPGGDASVLLDPVFARYAGASTSPTLADRAGKQVATTHVQGMSVWFTVEGDVLWVITGSDEPRLEMVLEALP